MNITKKIMYVGLAATMLVGAASFTLAQTPSSTPNPAGKMVLEIGPEGRTLLRGTVDSVGTNSLVVKSWGGNWTVNVSSSTKLMPTTDLSKFQKGDFVGVQGTMDTNAAWTVNANLVRDWTIREQVKTNEKEVRQMIKDMKPRNFQGLASAVSSNSFTLTSDGVAYTVNLTTNAKIFNQKFLAMAFADIKNGDTIRVYGTLLGTTITASVVRDIFIQ